MSVRVLIFVAASLAAPSQVVLAQAQDPPPVHDATALAKESQNPVGNLTSIPLQFNFNTGGDLEDRTFFNLNLQPVVPFKLSENWSMIWRTIVPVNSFPGLEGQRFSGFGDIQQQLFVTPARPEGIIWGVGPAFSFPTATATPSETGTWAGGVNVVVLKTTSRFVFGSLISQLWPMSDEGGAPQTDLLTIQPFVNYNFGPGWALSTAPLILANWDASSGNEWTVPLGVGLTRTTVLNRRPMNVGVTYFYNVERPDGSPAHQLRFVIVFLFPR